MPDGPMSPEKPNYVTPGPPNPFAEKNPGQGPGTLGKYPAEMVNFDKPGRGEEDDRSLEDEFASRHYRTESLSVEFITTAENPYELFFGLRRLEASMEDLNVPPNLAEHYTPPRMLSVIKERAVNIGYPMRGLIKGEIMEDYSSDTGVGVLKRGKEKYAGFAISTQEIPIIDRGRFVGTRAEHRFGSPKERSELARSYERAALELEARSIIDEHAGLRGHPALKDSLGGLTSTLHERAPKFTGDHLNALFNMPDVTEITTNPENHTLGDRVEEAMFCHLVMLSSGSRSKMETLLARPGAKHLISKMAKEHSARIGTHYTYDNWLRDYIGDVNEWDNDRQRDPKDSYKKEKKDGHRGKLTQWGNICAFTGGPGEYGGSDEKEFIEEVIGGAVGSSEAAWVATSTMKAIGAFASEGYDAYPNGKTTLTLGQSAFISPDDTGKLHHYGWMMKEGVKGNPTGLNDMIGKVPDVSLNLFDWAQVRVRLASGETVRRSIWDAWLGNPEIEVIDILTLESTGKKVAPEGCNRLGSLDFASLDRDFHRTYALLQWLAGSEQGLTGIIPEIQKVDFKKDDFHLNKLKKIWKYMGIVFNPPILAKGSMQRYDMKHVDVLRKNLFRNLMYARIHSFSFSTDVLSDTYPMFETDAGKVGVPAPVVAVANIKKILENDPFRKEGLSEVETYYNYIDAYHRLTALVDKTIVGKKMKLPGTDVDRRKAVNEKFSPEDLREKALEKHVGKVVGKTLW